MSTLHNNHRARLSALTLLSLVVAQLATPAFGGVAGRSARRRRGRSAPTCSPIYRSSATRIPTISRRSSSSVCRSAASARCALALRPFGYYEPKVTSEVRREGSGSEQNYHVTITVTPGEPVIVDKVDVKVTGAGRRRPGIHQHHQRPADPEAATVSTTPATRRSRAACCARPRPTATSTRAWCATRCASIRRRTSRDVDIEFETGERYRFGKTTITQDAIDESLARRFLRYHENDPFNATELLRTQFALDDSLYFSTVEVLPEDRDRDNHIVPDRASWPSRIAGTACSTASATAPTRRCAAPSPGKTGA